MKVINPSDSEFGKTIKIAVRETHVRIQTRILFFKHFSWFYRYAPESLRDGKFSARSDVWSYGVLLFEMFSYGDDPIISSTSGDSTQLLELLESGIRLPRPAQCPDYVYSELMTKCWSTTDKERLTFAQIIEVIKTLSPSLIDWLIFKYFCCNERVLHYFDICYTVFYII